MDESESPGRESVRVPMVDPEIVKQLRALHAVGWGSKRIAQELGIEKQRAQVPPPRRGDRDLSRVMQERAVTDAAPTGDGRP
jgi:hypothetical protein